MTQLNEAVVLITGAAGGFGQEFIRQLLMANSQLILTDLNQSYLEKQAEIIQRQVTTGIELNRSVTYVTQVASYKSGSFLAPLIKGGWGDQNLVITAEDPL